MRLALAGKPETAFVSSEPPGLVRRNGDQPSLLAAGAEEIGWRPLAACVHHTGEFDAGHDIGYFDDRPDTWVAVPVQHFAVFFPEDAHAPLGGRGALRKAIVKVAVRW